MSKYEILPPLRNLPAPHNNRPVSVSPPNINAGGAIQSYFDRKQLERDARQITSMTAKSDALNKLIQSRTEVVQSYTTFQRQLHALMELPEILANELAYRRAERAERLRELQHTHHMSDLKRDTDSTRAMVALVDAQQQLESQKEHGKLAYDIGWKRRQYELLDMEMDAAAKREILRQQAVVPENDDDTEAILNDYRQQLAQHGLDTSRIDAALQRRKR